MIIIKAFIKQHKKDLIVQLIFLIIPLLFLIEFLFEQRFHDGDGIFNYSRLFEASIDIHQGQLPQFNFNTGSVLGGATNSFYPWLTFLPLILLKPLMSAFTFWYSLNTFIIWTGEEASYFAVRKFGKSRIYAFAFTIIYIFATFFMTQYYALNDVGATFDAMLTPLIIFYWYQWLTKGKWLGLTTCMLIIIYTNIVTPLLIVLCLALMTAFWYDKVSWVQIKSGLKATIIFILCTAPIWIPICVLYFNNRMSLPVFANNDSLQVPEFDFPFHLLFVPEQISIWTYTDIFAFILSLFYWRRMPQWCKKCIIISIIITILCTRPIAVYLIGHTPFSVFQFMHRFSFFNHLLYSAVLVEIITRFGLKEWNSFIVLLTLFVIAFCTFGILPSEEYNTYETKNEVLFSKQFKPFKTYKRYTDYLIHEDGHGSFRQFSFQKLNGPLFNHYVPAMFDEYYPHSCVNYKKAVRDHHPLIEPSTNGSNYIKNGLKLYKTHNGNYSVPIATFHTQEYLINVNGEQKSLMGRDNLLRVHLHHGINRITVKPYVMPYRIISFIIAIAGLLIILVKYYSYLHYGKYMLHCRCKSERS